MDIQQYIQKKKDIQMNLLNYLDNEEEENYDILMKSLQDLAIEEDRNELKSILLLTSSIVQNHHRSKDFFKKIDKILSNYISQIKKHFTNHQIFDIFAPNQRILFYFYRNGLISDDDLLKLPDRYIGYFYPEIQSKINEELRKKICESNQYIFDDFDLEEFNKKREIGENDNKICQLIREDSIDEFIQFIHQTNIPLNSEIKKSLFETNYFMQNHFRYVYDHDYATLIEYAFFFGSIRIVKYLLLNKISLSYTLWPFAIHSNNGELIHLLEENGLIPEESLFITRENRFIPRRNSEVKNIWNFNTYKTILIESVKCHHIDIYNYIRNNIPEIEPEDDSNVSSYHSNVFIYDSSTDVIESFFKYFDYYCFPDKIENEKLFFYACKYEYDSIVVDFLKNKIIDVNTKIVQKKKNSYKISKKKIFNHV